MSCSDEVKIKILSEVTEWLKQAKASGFGNSAEEFQKKTTAFYLSLSQRYGQEPVREILKALNDQIEGPEN